MLRFQLPGYSPLRADDIAATALNATDMRVPLRARLQAQFNADALLLGSGTIALGLALKAAAQRRPGLPVAMPGYACYDLATAALMAEVPVVLYDLDPDTLAPRADSLEAACASGVAAIVAVHLYGVPVDLTALRALSQQHSALLIEDAAQGIGASLLAPTHDGAAPAQAALGSFGDFGILSFGRGKGLTGGVGGALIAKAQGLAALDALEHSSVRDRNSPKGSSFPDSRAGIGYYAKLVAQWLLGRPSLYGVPARIPALRLGETVFHPPGDITAMPAAAARLVSRTYTRALEEAEVRRHHAAALRAALPGSGFEPVQAPPSSIPGWLRFPVKLPAGHRPHTRRDAALGVMPGYPRPLRELEAFRRLLRGNLNTPGADSLAANLWTLPTHSLLTSADLDALRVWMHAELRPN